MAEEHGYSKIEYFQHVVAGVLPIYVLCWHQHEVPPQGASLNFITKLWAEVTEFCFVGRGTNVPMKKESIFAF